MDSSFNGLCKKMKKKIMLSFSYGRIPEQNAQISRRKPSHLNNVSMAGGGEVIVYCTKLQNLSRICRQSFSGIYFSSEENQIYVYLVWDMLFLSSSFFACYICQLFFLKIMQIPLVLVWPIFGLYGKSILLKISSLLSDQHYFLKQNLVQSVSNLNWNILKPPKALKHKISIGYTHLVKITAIFGG